MVRIQGWSHWATGGPQDSWLHVCVGAVDQEGHQELWSILRTMSSRREDEALEGGAGRQGDGIAPMSQAPCEDQDPGSQTSPVGSIAAASGPTRPLLCAALTSQLREASSLAVAKPRAEEMCLPSASQGNRSSILLLWNGVADSTLST